MNTPIYLIGFMGAGKTTIGALLAQHLSLPFIDLDARFEQQQKCSIVQWFNLHDEASFRDIESALLGTINQNKAVIATGGGVVLRPENRAVLQDAQNTTIWLHPTWEVLWRRIQQSNRPLVQTLQTEETLHQLWQTRIPLYRRSADIIIESENPLSELITIFS